MNHHMAVHRRFLHEAVRAGRMKPSELTAEFTGTPEEFCAALLQGPEWYPVGECDNFDEVKGECRGHNK